MSNTKILEDLGWTGLLVEPSEKAVKRCKTNRKSPCEWCALVSDEYKGDSVVGDFFFDGEDGLGAWSGVHKNLYGLRAAREVPAITLTKLLNYHKVSKVDFFSLDVEGYEMEVLKGTDLNTIDITYILIEVNTSEYSLNDLDNYLAKFGYKNLGCLSGFTDKMTGWNGLHNDYLYGKLQ